MLFLATPAPFIEESTYYNQTKANCFPIDSPSTKTMSQLIKQTWPTIATLSIVRAVTIRQVEQYTGIDYNQDFGSFDNFDENFDNFDSGGGDSSFSPY